ncbi:MAG TPA: hypothetical protein VFS02_20135 [Telluria sp.]|nr:hypothetical protein [Telluria sp.]
MRTTWVIALALAGWTLAASVLAADLESPRARLSQKPARHSHA